MEIIVLNVNYSIKIYIFLLPVIEIYLFKTGCNDIAVCCPLFNIVFYSFLLSNSNDNNT